MMGMIVSVNVGLPQDVAWQGRTVRTGVWKTPVAERWTVPYPATAPRCQRCRCGSGYVARC